MFWLLAFSRGLAERWREVSQRSSLKTRGYKRRRQRRRRGFKHCQGKPVVIEQDKRERGKGFEPFLFYHGRETKAERESENRSSIFRLHPRDQEGEGSSSPSAALFRMFGKIY
jgi:hypothetical protein